MVWFHALHTLATLHKDNCQYPQCWAPHTQTQMHLYLIVLSCLLIILCCPLVFPGSPFPLPETDSACPFSGEQCLPKWAHRQCRSFCTGTDCRRSRHPQTGGQRGRKSQAHSRRMSRPIVFVYEHGHAALNFCHMIDPSIFDRFAPQDRPRYRTTDACQPELRQAHGRVHEGCEAGVRQGAHVHART